MEHVISLVGSRHTGKTYTAELIGKNLLEELDIDRSGITTHSVIVYEADELSCNDVFERYFVSISLSLFLTLYRSLSVSHSLSLDFFVSISLSLSLYLSPSLTQTNCRFNKRMCSATHPVVAIINNYTATPVTMETIKTLRDSSGYKYVVIA